MLEVCTRYRVQMKRFSRIKGNWSNDTVLPVASNIYMKNLNSWDDHISGSVATIDDDDDDGDDVDDDRRSVGKDTRAKRENERPTFSGVLWTVVGWLHWLEEHCRYYQCPSKQNVCS